MVKILIKTSECALCTIFIFRQKKRNYEPKSGVYILANNVEVREGRERKIM
jgi:hypothetical protein